MYWLQIQFAYLRLIIGLKMEEFEFVDALH